MKRKYESLDRDEKRLSRLLFKNPEEFAERLKRKDTLSTDTQERTPAWNDDDDNNFQVNKLIDTKKKGLYVNTIKEKYVNLVGTPNWAKVDKPKPDTDEHDNVLRKVGHLQSKHRTSLQKDFLEYKSLCKINKQSGKEGPVISAVEFHPTSSVALVGGQSGTITLYSVGEESNKLHSFFMPKLPLLCAHFSPDGTEAYLASNNSHNFCVYDLMKTKRDVVPFPKMLSRPTIFELSHDGEYFAASSGCEEVLIIGRKSRELIRVLKHNDNVAAATYSHNCEKLYTLCVTGEVYVWNLSTFRVEHRFVDEGCVNGSKITVSNCGRLMAVGSKEGIVNIYDSMSLTSSNPIPLKTIQHLKTMITHLKFNCSTEILAVSSAIYPNALKLVHIPSYHVFKNIPDPAFNFHNVGPVSFSPNSGFMALGNNKSTASLFRLKHFKNY